MAGYDCETLIERLADILGRAVESCGCSCIALSGGLDTTAIAAVARARGLPLRGYLAYYTGGLPRDLPYALYTARVLGVELRLVPVDDAYIAERAGRVLECIGVSGDAESVELRNDIVFLAAVEAAARDGCNCIILGDGGDELLAGYTYLRSLEGDRLRGEILRLGVRGRYPGRDLAECIGVTPCTPYLSDELIEAVLNAPVECLRDETMRGKEPLRTILLRAGLRIVAEREKTPAEMGAGTDVLNAARLREVTGLPVRDPSWMLNT